MFFFFFDDLPQIGKVRLPIFVDLYLNEWFSMPGVGHIYSSPGLIYSLDLLVNLLRRVLDQPCYVLLTTYLWRPISADVKFQKLGHFDKGAWFLVYLHSVVVFPSYIVKLVIKTHNKFIFLIASLPQRNIKCLYKMSISLYPSITYFSELPNTFTTVRLMLSQQRCFWFAPRSSIGRSGSGNTDLQLFQSEPNSTMVWLT